MRAWLLPWRETRNSAKEARNEVLGSLVGLAMTYTLLWVSWRIAKATASLLEGENFGQRLPEACREWLLRRYGTSSAVPTLTEHEIVLASCVVGPDSLKSSLDDVGGLEDVVEELRDLVVLPLLRPELFGGRSKLVRAPRGVLLYGEPGTGKSLLARAVARESAAALLNVRASTLSDKYFGESNKLVAAMFSLACKLAPAIVFIDEVDGLLSARRSTDADVTLALRAEFMTHLDGLLTDQFESSVVVLAATNRPYDLDPAVLRRLSRQFRVGLPDQVARLKILTLLLRNETCDVDLPRLAQKTAGYSGSDLEEVCRAAATKPIRDVCKFGLAEPRPISEADFSDALSRVAPTAHQALAFRAQQNTPIFKEQHSDKPRPLFPAASAPRDGLDPAPDID